MHKPPLPPIVYSRLFPVPKSTDPPNFHTYISKQLVPEVRAETARFYGHIDCVEAQYPGLDYAVPAHRLRLSRFPHHRRLFQILDELRLTNHEVQTLCKWEGTRWARERYEKDTMSRVRETTFEDVARAIPEPPTVTRMDLSGDGWRSATGQTKPRRARSRTTADAIDVLFDDVQDEVDQQPGDSPSKGELEDQEDDEEGQSSENDAEQQEAEESEDELQQSVGVELNQRLMAATEARSRGEEAVLDADWEQWLKEAAERGAIPPVPASVASQSAADSSAIWTQPPSTLLGTDPVNLPLPASFSMPAMSNSTIDGAAAPRAGTAI
ncbi:MAG: hypothetical protein Q9220_005593 [cf. Caloplaca sp. 1 TL-2023]